MLLDATRQLRKSGARPVLERSPTAGKHRGGGRLWLFFARPIDPGRAWATAVKRASALARFKEFWPTLELGPEDRGQAVRLPAGLYQPEGAWCELAEFADAPTWLTGSAAAALILAALTLTGWVTEPTPPMPQRDNLPIPSLPVLDLAPVPSMADRPMPAAFGDPQWLAAYGSRRDSLRFAVIAKEAIAWYDATHDVRQLLPKEANGYARATWRNERTSCVAYLPNNCWIDYGEGRRPSGRKDGGDAFEALCRLEGFGRGEALRRIVLPLMLGEARAVLDAAARANVGVPGWVAAITTPPGWADYRHLRRN